MATLSTYLANKLIDHSNGVAPYAMPTVYVGLVTSASSPAGPGTEANYTGYNRVPLASLMGSATAGADTNTGVITFPQCTGGDNVIVGVFTADAQSAGNMLKYTTVSLHVVNNVVPTFPISNFSMSLS